MKRILVLSGGGSKGAYEVGALKYLINELGREYDAICGISVGALNGSFLAQYSKKDIKKGIEDLEQFWLNIKQKDVYKKWAGWPLTVPWKPSVYNSKPLKQLIHNNLDVVSLNESEVDLYVGAVSLENGHIQYRTQKNPNILEYIEASAAFPLMLTPVKIKDQYWVDGGVRDVTPLNVAVKRANGTHIDVVVAQEYFKAERKKEPNTIKDLPFILEVLMNEVVEGDLQKAELYNDILKEIPEYRGKKKIDLKIIRPHGNLNHNSLKFDHEQIKKDIELGYNDAKRVFENGLQ